MERRKLLKAAGSSLSVGIASIAGCLGSSGGGGEETTGEGETTEASGTTEEGETTTGASSGESVTHYRLGGKAKGWMGREPKSIADKTNPTLNLEAGKKYKITWENLDGVSHDLAIQDTDGNNIKKTKMVSKEGKTLTLTFTATEKMAQYICTVHPSTMVGDISFEG